MIRKLYELDLKRLGIVSSCLSTLTGICPVGVWPLEIRGENAGTIWFEREENGMVVFHFISDRYLGTFKIGEGLGICDFEEDRLDAFVDFSELLGLTEINSSESKV